jgi:hypothetical protein
MSSIQQPFYHYNDPFYSNNKNCQWTQKEVERLLQLQQHAILQREMYQQSK